MTAVSVRRPARRVLAAVALPVAVLLLATACSSSSKSSTPAGGGGATTGATTSSASSSSGAAASATNMVDVKNFAFTPMDLTVAVGAKVTWKFDDSAGHTVKADDGSFTSPTLNNGKTFDFTFTKAGTYKYICSIHQYMAGTITVK